MNKKLIWLDDTRRPTADMPMNIFTDIFGKGDVDTIWIQSFSDFVEEIHTNGVPDYISFDYDLALPNHLKRVQGGLSKRKSRKLKAYEKNGYDCAKFLGDFCTENHIRFPIYFIHSENKQGKAEIDNIIRDYLTDSQ
jgi:hypothetical protein